MRPSLMKDRMASEERNSRKSWMSENPRGAHIVHVAAPERRAELKTDTHGNAHDRAALSSSRATSRST